MADPFDPNTGRSSGGADDVSVPSEAPFEHEPMEVEDLAAPRRAASARLVVDSQIGSEAAMREAMDPANQSLAEALRLSFKVLQVVILVLLALFVVSSCRTVGEDQGGVFTRFGKIVPLDGSTTLTPGLKWGKLPYPIGEFVLFQQTNRQVDVGEVFAPQTRGLPQDQLLERADVNNPLNPRYEGSLLTRDGDLMHMKIAARYMIQNPAQFAETVNDADAARNANRLVQLALQEAAVHVAAEHALEELTGRPDEPQSLIKQRAQTMLDSMECGIQLTSVDVSDNIPPLAILKIAGALTQAEQDVRTQIETAQKNANKTLIGVAGENYQVVVDLIEQYERAVDSNSEQQAETILTSINERLESKDISGQVSEIIGNAKAYQDQIESTLGNDVRRFESVLAAFKEHPEPVIKQRWMEAFANVVKKPDAEIIYVPANVLTMQLILSGSAQVQELRKKYYLERKGHQADLKDINPMNPFIMRGIDMRNEGPGRQLQRDVQGNLLPAGSGGQN